MQIGWATKNSKFLNHVSYSPDISKKATKFEEGFDVTIFIKPQILSIFNFEYVNEV